MKDMMDYIWSLVFGLFGGSGRTIAGYNVNLSYSFIVILAYFCWDYYKRVPDRENCEKSCTGEVAKESFKMTDMQVATVAGNVTREIEKETTEETTVSEMSKDLGHTKIAEASAKFEQNKTLSIQEENRSHQSESSRTVVQTVSQEVSANRQVTKSSFETSSSYSMEETEEYEIEG